MTPKHFQKELNNETLALFFTFGVSLKNWYETGLIIRDATLYNELSKHFRHIYFFTYGGREDLNFKKYLSDNITVVPMPFLENRPSGFLGRILRLAYSVLLPAIHYKKLRQVDIIKSHQMRGGLVAVWSKIVFRKKYLARCGFVPSRANYPKRNIIRRAVVFLNDLLVCRFADIVCVPNRGELEYIEKKFKVSKNKISINPNWIDTDRFYPFKDKSKINNNNKICFLGRFEPRKQPLFLIEALKDLGNIELLFIGKGSLEPEIRRRIKESNIKGRVIPWVKNEELPEYLNSVDIYTILSFWEGGSPKTLLEAMACGLAVIGINADGVNDVIKQGENGLLCDNNLKSLRESVFNLIKDKKLREKLGENARKTILEEFSLKRGVVKELNLYKNL